MCLFSNLFVTLCGCYDTKQSLKMLHNIKNILNAEEKASKCYKKKWNICCGFKVFYPVISVKLFNSFFCGEGAFHSIYRSLLKKHYEFWFNCTSLGCFLTQLNLIQFSGSVHIAPNHNKRHLKMLYTVRYTVTLQKYTKNLL